MSTQGRTVDLRFSSLPGIYGEKVVLRVLDKGNTVLVIEHNLDVVKSADWIVDLGPEGGSGGGLVVAQGTPEQIAANPASHTGQFLAPILARTARTPQRAARGRATAAKAAPTRKAATKTPATKTAATKATATKATATKKAARASAAKRSVTRSA